jgi:hypothetical protein
MENTDTQIKSWLIGDMTPPHSLSSTGKYKNKY